jgi:hypothetical protein
MPLPKISYNPRTKIVINEYSQFRTLEELLWTVFPMPSQDPLGPLRWVDGLVIFVVPMGIISERVADEYLKGVVYWDYLAVAPMKEFQGKFATLDGKQCIIVDSSEIGAFQALAKFIKRNLMVSRATRHPGKKD